MDSVRWFRRGGVVGAARAGLELHNFPVEEAVRAPFCGDEREMMREIVGHAEGEGVRVGVEEGRVEWHGGDAGALRR